MPGYVPPPQPQQAAGGAEAYDALRRIEDRLDRASSAAERLIAEAATKSSARARGGPPRAGWQATADDAGRGDAERLAQLLRALRELVPPELQLRVTEALRELMLALRALIDWYLERAERRRAEPVEVQHIPIV